METQVIVRDATALSHFEAVAQEAQEGRLLKFVKGKWYVGDDELPANREFIAHVHQLNRGWIKFADSKVIDQKIGMVATGFKPPEREELGDTDQAQWETDSNGTRRDPWTHQYFLSLEDAETGDLLTFVTGSQGGNAAIGRLCGQFARNARNGLPVIKLASSHYKHKSFGRVETPDLPVVSWTGGGHVATAPSKQDLNDEIPF